MDKPEAKPSLFLVALESAPQNSEISDTVYVDTRHQERRRPSGISDGVGITNVGRLHGDIKGLAVARRPFTATCERCGHEMIGLFVDMIEILNAHQAQCAGLKPVSTFKVCESCVPRLNGLRPVVDGTHCALHQPSVISTRMVNVSGSVNYVLGVSGLTFGTTGTRSD
jgi:hypothetical protein